eukprot:6193420-Pleurochrysis_carterae.AAC.1
MPQCGGWAEIALLRDLGRMGDQIGDAGTQSDGGPGGARGVQSGADAGSAAADGLITNSNTAISALDGFEWC